MEGKTVFIADALPGETVSVVRHSFHGSFDEARLEAVLVASPDRVQPQCRHFGVCGGCVLQHLKPERQLEFKHHQLLEAFERIGKVTPAASLPPLQGDVWHYRRRARLGARYVFKKERALVGFRERSANLLAELKGCEVLKEPLHRMLEPLAGLIGSLSLRDKVPQVEVAVADNATALVFRVLAEPTTADREQLAAFALAHQVQVFLQPGDYTTVEPLVPGYLPLHYALPGFAVDIEFLPADFIQVNGDLNRRMVHLAIELLQPEGNDRVLDLFCGLGNFSLPLARRAREVVGVDGEPGLIERARGNARRNAIGNATFFAANLAEKPEGVPWLGNYDRVLLDPPRAGALEVLPAIAASGAGRVVYISCHPASLARDAGEMVRAHGFTLKAAGVMDMFAHTAHVESIAVFER
jgi:23S rRNA (uracil1939-C5)-methyltransferase